MELWDQRIQQVKEAEKIITIEVDEEEAMTNGNMV